jgi:voltage-gated potassium channel
MASGGDEVDGAQAPGVLGSGTKARSRLLERQRHFQRRLVKLEPQFVPLLLSVLLPVVLLPVSALPSGRFLWLLPVLFTIQVGQSLRSLPALGPGLLSQVLLALQRVLGFGAITGLWTLTLVAHRSEHQLLRFGVLVISGLFSMLSTLKLVLLLARVPRVNAQVMAGAAAGYIYLGLTGGLVASTLQVGIPGTFSLGLDVGHELLVDRLTYFSFVVLAGLGLGDVLPHNPLGERFVILLSLSGTLYLALLMGLLIGRFIATQEVELEFDALADEVEDDASPIGERLAGLGRGTPSGGGGMKSGGPPGKRRPQ